MLLKVLCFLYPISYWSQRTVLILVLLLPVLRCVTFQVSVSPLSCSISPFWTPLQAFSLLPGWDAWPSASSCSSQGSERCRRGWRTRGMPRCKEIRQVLHQLPQVQNKKKMLDWALLTTAVLTHIGSTHRDTYFCFVWEHSTLYDPRRWRLPTRVAVSVYSCGAGVRKHSRAGKSCCCLSTLDRGVCSQWKA